ncbi:putative dsRNA-binding protein [Streptomyces sp. NPDC007095]|uniref:putative dsRNA-binding protein n=1 Tax=Streptomyces sp. NPDC007095 TaxID=3154482 RepID=UPI0033CECA7F
MARWLALASCHSSYFYENPHLFPDMSDETLTMLGKVGAAAADVMIADDYTSKFAPDELGLQNKAIVTLRSLVRNELGSWIAKTKAVLLGLGEAQGKAASVSQYVAYQVIGVLVLHGHFDAARLLLRAVCPSLLDPPAVNALDPMTALHKYVPAQEMRWTYVADGPQHDQSFTATAVDARGRRARGVAASKKKARSAAAESFLDMYEPQWRDSSAEGSVRQPNPSTYRSADREHDEAVADLETMFELPSASRPWLAQALTHSSYAYEHKAEVEAARQRDNALLANYGSFVFNFLAAEARARAVLSRTLSPEDDEARIVTPANADCRALGQALFLRTGYLLGRGETSGVAAESVENPAQAVAAVAWRTHGSRMLLRRPEVLDHWLGALDNAQDPHTQLQALCSAYSVHIEEQYSETGAHHERSFWCTLILRQGDRTLRWRGADGGSNKTRAKLLASQELLDVLDASLSVEELQWSASEREVLRFLLTAQMRAMSTLKARTRTKAAARGDLGVALLTTGDIDSFVAWTREVEQLVGPVPEYAREGIASFYRSALRDARKGTGSALARAERLTGGDSSAIATTFAATAVRRAMSQPETGTLRDVIARWWQEQARATPVRLNDELMDEEPNLLPVQLGAVREVLNWCGEAAASIDGRIDVEFDARDGKTHLLVAMPGVDVAATCSALSDVLTRTLPFVDCMPDDDRLLVRLTDIPGTEDLGSLAQLGLEEYLWA